MVAAADRDVRAYEKDLNTHVAVTELPALTLLANETPGMRMNDLTFIWANLNVEGTKGHHGAIKPRLVPLKREIRARLIDWCEGNAGLIFPFWNGTSEDLAQSTKRLSARFASLFDYAMVPNFTEHDLRHEACCRWVLLKGERVWMFNETEICKIMGRTDTKMMLRYASLRGEDLADRLLEPRASTREAWQYWLSEDLRACVAIPERPLRVATRHFFLASPGF